ncbi:TetR/AcrR family transcriptional regulator [Streptomyces ipomoeae]|uniref:TetR/AcrR family transcriptional regulator n=1 Tax=Streptomyces ipomoeae TaxID=103232 RepID=A0A540QK51_9ACTN|nr:TetR/AcrR family transcriptional regulator [Streptomyces ipomoeae]MDX2821895.1 TetR/AcrR family transcriptional regulator [Streptomyces ipomoeae]MDX2874240.1 TetR/AcrR family transcriptional regulator [Streptomyces ipomoeae]MDX2939243.1 TetR/AcrR family transcriptional regulator [Streptomyces ipomoeae]TQE21187.1 TetR/AcrR family transcriptional regulator [Streptomyces ipomoeae]TQE23595.1 TetR/AcrR family transcriptional regulator [Streptomyces ipomoeae]
MASTSPVAAKPGRPRDPGADERILRAVVDELAETGIVGFRINSVAARARVAKRTLYSRWPERDDLILAGLSTLSGQLHPPRTGSLNEDMRLLYDAIAETLDSPRWLIAARCTFELPDYPELYAPFQRDCIDQPLAVIEDVLFDAQKRGELRPGIDRAVAAETFAASIANFSTHIARLRGVSAHGVRDRFLDLFLHGLGAEDGAGGHRHRVG